jgi:hypothetical protein
MVRTGTHLRPQWHKNRQAAEGNNEEGYGEINDEAKIKKKKTGSFVLSAFLFTFATARHCELILDDTTRGIEIQNSQKRLYNR